MKVSQRKSEGRGGGSAAVAKAVERAESRKGRLRGVEVLLEGRGMQKDRGRGEVQG